MIKKEITYTDYDGISRTETFYFNLNKAELLEMELSSPGGLQEMVERIVKAKDQPTIIRLIKELLINCQGEKSLDGKVLLKTPEVHQRFQGSPAYEIMFMMLATDDEKSAEFINALIPADLQEAVKKEAEAKRAAELAASTVTAN